MHVKATDFKNGAIAQFKLTYADPHSIDKNRPTI
jgi:hypothetical protein